MFYIRILITALMLFNKYEVLSNVITFTLLMAIYLIFYLVNCIQEPYITKKIESLYQNSLLLMILTLSCVIWKEKDFFIY